MRVVPCRVVCYYNFNVKSWSKKMREGSLGIWNGSIHLPFLLVSKCAQRKRKKQGVESWSWRKGIILYQTTVISPFGQVAMVGFSLLHQWRYGRPILWACSFIFLLPVLSWRKTLFIFDSHLQMHFSLCHLWWKHMCDHGQGFPFLKCLLLLLLCQCVSEENESWMRPLFGFALSLETGS